LSHGVTEEPHDPRRVRRPARRWTGPPAPGARRGLLRRL